MSKPTCPAEGPLLLWREMSDFGWCVPEDTMKLQGAETTCCLSHSEFKSHQIHNFPTCAAFKSHQNDLSSFTNHILTDIRVASKVRNIRICLTGSSSSLPCDTNTASLRFQDVFEAPQEKKKKDKGLQRPIRSHLGTVAL